jgi:serine/threonine-protein kinase
MEYVDGHPLTRYLVSADALPLNAKIGIVRQTAEALDHAHERGVVHRDIKPGNILIAKDGRVKVTDFGIARFTSATTSDLTRTGTMIGSPAYMSPEQIRGEKLDGPLGPVFRWGSFFTNLLTGTRPFPGESITTLVYQILHTEPRDPCEIKADLPAASREVMAVLLAKQPEKRPENAKSLSRELKRIEKFQRESEMTPPRDRRRGRAGSEGRRGAAVPSAYKRSDASGRAAASHGAHGRRAAAGPGLARARGRRPGGPSRPYSWPSMRSGRPRCRPVRNVAGLRRPRRPTAAPAPPTSPPTAEPAAAEPTPLTLPTPARRRLRTRWSGRPESPGLPRRARPFASKPTAPPREDEKVAVVASAEPPPPPPPPAAAD